MSITLTPQWATAPGVLGTATELTTTTFSIALLNATTATTVSVISGKLPTGFTLSTSTTTGVMLIAGTSPAILQKNTSTFVVRATNEIGITDRTFRIDVVSTSTVNWVTPAGTLNAGIEGQQYGINKSKLDFQFAATTDIIPVSGLRYFVAAGDGNIPPGLELTHAGRLHGIVNDPALSNFSIQHYQFYVTVTDGFTSSRRQFALIIAGINALQTDTTIIDADTTAFLADSSSIVLPEWADAVNLGTVRANNHQVIQISPYDAYPKIGPTLFDWVTASIIPATRAIADSPSNSVGYQTLNRENDNSIHLKNVSVFPLIGQIFRLDPYVDGADTSEYEVTNVVETTTSTGVISFGIRLSDSVVLPATLPVRILDNTQLYFGTQSQHPLNFHLDPDSGSIYGTFDFDPKYTKTYTFTIRIFKININNHLNRYIGPWKGDRYYRANDIVRVKTEIDQPDKPNNGHIPAAINLPITGNIIGDRYVSIYDSHLWVYTGNGPVRGFVDVGHVTYGSTQTDHYTYYIALNTDPITDSITGDSVRPPASFDTTQWVPYNFSNSDVSFEDKVCTLTVRGDIKNSINFVTEADLGTFIAGYQSERSISAEHISEPLEITYNVKSGILPPGLTLQNDGTITGKVPYNFKTTFDFTLDGIVDTFDVQYDFTVSANDVFDRGIATRKYTSTISQTDPTSYTHIYATPMLAVEKRNAFSQFINNEVVFNPSAMYRIHDPAFGVQRTMKAYIEHGIEQIKLDDYAEPLRKYFWKKRFYFGKIQSKAAYDENGVYVYDAVYVEIIDPFVNNDGISIGAYLNSANVTVFPNSAFNIQSTLEAITMNNITVKTDQFLRPRFMRTVQVGTGSPLGFVLAAPLCYAKPGAGDGIVKRAELYNFDFSTLDFDIDRLVVEDSLPKESAKYMLFPRREVVGGDTGINITDYRLYGDDLLEIDTEGNDPLYLEI